MNPFRSAILSAVLLAAGSIPAQAAGVFGIELGSDIGAYSHDAQAVFVRHELKMFELVPPAPDTRFDTYAVDTHKGRIVRIMASSPDDSTLDAEATLSVLRGLKQELIADYGTPSMAMGEVEDAGDELLAHLVDEGGLEVLEWDCLENRTDGLGAVYVFLAGAEDENGRRASYCTLYLESQDYAELSETARLHGAQGAEEHGYVPAGNDVPTVEHAESKG